MAKEVIVGIDLGTTYSAIAYINDFGKPEIIPNAEQSMITPSVVYFEGSDEIVVGEDARNMAIVEPSKVVEYVKRQMGNNKDEWCFEYRGKEYNAAEVSSLILSKLKSDAEKALSADIKDAVITVPAYFNDGQREATIKAGQLAGLNVLRIINEPTAAALAYGVHKIGSKQHVLVFDLGGGTFDVTVMRIEGNHIQMLATNGDHLLGGKDWDDEIIKYVSEQFQTRFGLDPLDDLQAYHDIQSRSVQAKIALSSRPKTSLVCNFSGKSLNIEITKDLLEKITAHLVDRCKTLVEIVLDEAKLKSSLIDTVLLAGGATRMPMIREMLKNYFGKLPDSSINPDECVAIGAAIQGALLSLEKGLISKLAEKYLGGITSTDINSHSLGIVSLKDGELHNSIIIPKNHPIPCQKSKSDYVTSSYNQTSLDIYLTQGEDANPENCTVLGSYEFYDIPPRPAGKTKLEIIFKYNLNGMVEVDARDVTSNKALPKKVKKEEIDLNNLSAKVAKPVDIVFVIDFTGSMGPYIDGIKTNIYSFVDELAKNNVGWKLGFVSFGDVFIGEPINVMKLTGLVDNFKTSVASQRMLGGGDEPESQLDGLFEALNIDFTSRSQAVFILITDSSPHEPDGKGRNSDEFIRKAKMRNAIVHIVGPNLPVYKKIANETGGMLIDIRSNSDMKKILNTLSENIINIATELSSQISR